MKKVTWSSWLTRLVSLVLVVTLALVLCSAASAQVTSENNERLKNALERFPAADADSDGVLTLDEARAFRRASRQDSAEQTPQGRQGKKRKQAESVQEKPTPTFENVAYGPHERNVLDFWKADAKKPTPLVVFIHGGGFRAGSKDKVNAAIIERCLAAGVSCAAINYRYRTEVPLTEVLRDSARAFQLMRYKAKEWNIDKERVASYGGSAGAGTSMWLAFHDDLADPDNPDPVLRESTRLTVACSNNGQFSYDIRQWVDVLGVPEDVFKQLYQPDLDQLSEAKERGVTDVEKLFADLDMRAMITKDDPPVFLFCSKADEEMTTRGIINHHPRQTTALKERCDEVGVEAVLYLKHGEKPEGAGSNIEEMLKFFFKHLEVNQG